MAETIDNVYLYLQQDAENKEKKKKKKKNTVLKIPNTYTYRTNSLTQFSDPAPCNRIKTLIHC